MFVDFYGVQSLSADGAEGRKVVSERMRRKAKTKFSHKFLEEIGGQMPWEAKSAEVLAVAS
jgi:hypothetical protein